ncbi:phosphotransferase [Microbacter sp. ANSKLAB05]|nr:phosphotransferase [Microbacter sp. ANSKLAB05]
MNRVVTALRDRFRASDALHASANALIASTALTSVAGLAFWAMAARWLPADAVGIGTALVSVLTLLANLATLGLRNGLVRFLPEAGGMTRQLIAWSYLTCALAAVALSGAFLVGQPWWAGQLGFLRDNAITITAFVVATVVWMLFVLQDHVLIGLRGSVWVPIENLAYSVAKIAVLPLLTAAATWAVLGATVLPAILAVAGVGVLVWRLTRSTVSIPVTGRANSLRHLVRFAAADQIAWMVWVATPQVLTLIVLHLRGPEASAYYYMANMIGYSLYLITSNIGSALIAESAYDPVRGASHARTALVHSVRLVLPLAVIGVLIGPYVLRFLGEDYAENAGTAMQLIILSALPQTIVGISVNTARVRREMSTVVVTYVFLAVAIWGGSWMTLQWWGVTGVGATILAAQTAAALGLLASGRTGLAVNAPTAGAVWATIARLSLAARYRATRREHGRWVRPALEALDAGDDSSESRVMRSDSDTLVVAVTGCNEDFVLKIGRSEAADRNLTRHVDAVATVRSRCGPEFAALLPEVLDRATVGERTVVRETLLPGHAPATVPAPVAMAAISRLHQHTARTLTVTSHLMAVWVDAPASYLLGLDPGDRNHAVVSRITAYLRESLLDEEITVSCTHGDFWPGNVLASGLDPDREVTGIVDWENFMDPGLPDTDPLHWYLSTRPGDLGPAVCSVLDDPGQLGEYRESVGVRPANPQIDPGCLVVLVWLWHVANTLARSTRSGPGRIWLLRNVHPVLRRFGSDSPSITGGLRAGHA